MTAPNDSILVTPGSGATIATHTVSSKEFEVWLRAEASGQHGDDPVGIYASSALDIFASTTEQTWISILNADATLIVDVLAVWQTLDVSSAIANTNQNSIRLQRTTAHSGGTLQTPVKLDSSSGALDADITVRSLPTSVTGSGEDLFAGMMQHRFSGTSGGHGQCYLWSPEGFGLPIVLRQNEGVRLYGASSASDSGVEHDSGIIFRVRA